MNARQLPTWVAGAIVAVGLLFLVVVFEAAPAAEAKPAKVIAITDDGPRRIAEHEGFPNGGKPYNDPAPGRHCTVGFGHLIHHGPCTAADRVGVWIRGQATRGRLTLAEAWRLLKTRLVRDYAPWVSALFRPGGDLRGKYTQHAYEGLLSAVFNLGPGLVTCASGFETMCRALKSGSLRAVAAALQLYNKAGGVTLPGLVRRRAEEGALILRPMAPFELFRADEARWIRRFDRLRGHTSPRAQRVRARLRIEMAERAIRIERTIRRTHDALSHRRSTRLAALARRAG